MEVEKTSLEGVLLIKPKVWEDSRGYFLETWNKQRYIEIGLQLPFVQDNHSSSTLHTLRGLHFQQQYPQGKLVSVSLGEVFDVAVDLRINSPTFGSWFGVILSEKNHYQMWIPPGLAHGFCVLSERAHFHYKCTEYYYPQDESCICWNDPDIGIDWPVQHPNLSHKDKIAQSWADYVASIT
ncbi:dTDP-4-dehydrorhamnose 3,5-epimerase [Lawsonia intracellularis]|uniref:dTDP-4-dehydrorhamnose 3,5-epimerase n=1 Tax=Lawsonia intracellularis (strain PHE/MN1-00) TaxID=363253 RepID=Q1MNX7_LAWIP|nr:dTDP-4-dehydrorhamnose 3,5-epimerase [Lawsonia intracellularis]AGC50677.1 dTDP-6-dehydrorhamnose 3,5-epimerase [Lawsonia intracellularis N343]KAA0204108.1 dTDP-4-dehydrorhamnose 3,5-epimerase [Lawsonia intracellularis]MBZ3893399.1 dTDP-4-dehydrorhamnose 3,5-epimerase [Lawsonia intracellularis]RBN31928.1 dTDP-4-dehydrorhamnose 3,5-epimerase [Lawsonia intracellularis]RBN32734.1 dTDP-4-dehydrorhamnose 3,5-epimerase [Lawsonia intracellularis]